ncbi:hypothetical protein [Aliikangiella sp. IMCC44359]|uniref:hypothetical protein n=1 Tax=Aliikangiella sp. IMCC44359 TaxID=3459125 RepID=UPI00403AD88C
MNFNLENLISACLSKLNNHNQISDFVEKSIQKPETVIRALGPLNSARIDKLYASDKLTIINVVWAPKMTLGPHNHNTWAVIGVYAGREDNIFWRRSSDESNGKINAAGAKSIGAKEVATLGSDVIHSVTNPTDCFTGAIHVYGGNFFEIARSEWETNTLTERAYNIEKNHQLFENENLLLKQKAAFNL